MIGGNWGHSAFQPEACNFCDDVVAEAADVSFGDAWLPEFTRESRGTNIVVSREPTIDLILQSGAETASITLHSLDPRAAVRSQAGGFRQRRQGLAVRLADDIQAGLSVPKKRVAPNVKAVSKRRARLLRQRRSMAAGSHRQFTEASINGDLNLYLGWMNRQIRRYERIETSLLRKALRIVRTIFDGLF